MQRNSTKQCPSSITGPLALLTTQVHNTTNGASGQWQYTRQILNTTAVPMTPTRGSQTTTVLVTPTCGSQTTYKWNKFAINDQTMYNIYKLDWPYLTLHRARRPIPKLPQSISKTDGCIQWNSGKSANQKAYAVSLIHCWLLAWTPNT